ncbi:MAG: hypothetical protein PVI52_04070 [Chromatiales bacterium]|jgi:hypothetical protein
MVTPVNSDPSVNNRVDGPGHSSQPLPTHQDRQAADSIPSRTRPTADSRVDIETARQRYQIENHRSAGGSRITTPDQANDLLGQILQQFTAHPGQSLQAQTPPSPAALSNLLERAPV